MTYALLVLACPVALCLLSREWVKDYYGDSQLSR